MVVAAAMIAHCGGPVKLLTYVTASYAQVAVTSGLPYVCPPKIHLLTLTSIASQIWSDSRGLTQSKAVEYKRWYP
jgi:hypothetical protein